MAHEVELGLTALERQAAAVGAALERMEKPDRRTRRILGEAEVEAALGRTDRALALVLGRLDDPDFRAAPERVGALLLAAELLERKGDEAGGRLMAKAALDAATRPEDRAEALLRWLRQSRDQPVAGRLAVAQVWIADGGSPEADPALAYEVGALFRVAQDRASARRWLGAIPATTEHGARAAFLAGVSFVEDGNLRDAERWFAALMAWSLPPLPEDHPRLAVEREVRALAALAAARLSFERGALDEAAAAYERVPAGSGLEAEACWERAFLESERGRPRAALDQVACVRQLGGPKLAQGEAALLEASLLAHAGRYEASRQAYRRLFSNLSSEASLAREALEGLPDPARFLFLGMERTAVEEGPAATPGPATLLAGAWTPAVDLAHRVVRGTETQRAEIERLGAEVDRLTRLLDRPEDRLELRRKSLERLAREVEHLDGHARRLAERSPGSTRLETVQSELRDHRRSIEGRRQSLAAESEARRAASRTELAALAASVNGLRDEARALASASPPPADVVARAALDRVLSGLDDAAMRAEVGLLDTAWVEKQSRTREVERLLAERKAAEQQADDALEQAEQ